MPPYPRICCEENDLGNAARRKGAEGEGADDLEAALDDGERARGVLRKRMEARKVTEDVISWTDVDVVSRLDGTNGSGQGSALAVGP